MNAYSTFNGYEVKDAKARKDIEDIKKTHISPEMFGAKGDGVTDDTQAIKDMISYAETLTPVYSEKIPCMDYRYVNFDFTGLYAVSEPIVFTSTIFLTLRNLKLKAIGEFSNFALLTLHGVSRNFTIDNCVIDCNYLSDRGIMVTDYTIGSNISNVYIGKFRRCGFEAVNNGYEIKFSNIKIEQRTWEETIPEGIEEGYGIKTSSGQQDYKFENVIVNYCKSYGFYCEGGTNFFANVHVWGVGCYFGERSNYFENCYFSDTVFTKGKFTFNNCLFSYGSNKKIISSLESADDSWNFSYGKIVNCTFYASGSGTTIFENVDTAYYPFMAGNSFQGVPVVTNMGNTAVFGNPFRLKSEGYYSGTNDVSVVNFGELVIYYGNGSTGKTFNFPNKLTKFIGCSVTPWITAGTPYAYADEYLITVTSETPYSWFVIGII